ncbi:MAG TPA: LytR C-terminal domain-containing protein [Alphaproteobacteria bacterium]
MRKFCVAVGLSTVLASGLGGCASLGGAPTAGALDAYASGKENFSAGRLGLALADFQRALQEQGPSVDRLNALAATYDRLSRFDLADRAYRQALVLDPNSPQTLNNIGYSYMLRGRPDLASAYLAKAQSVAKGDPVIGGNLALASDSLTGTAERSPAEASAPAQQAAVRQEPAPTIVEASSIVPLPAPVQSEAPGVMPVPAPVQTEAPRAVLVHTEAPSTVPVQSEAPSVVAQVAEASSVVAVPGPVSRPAVELLKPQHGTSIQPVAKGVFQLVTVGEEEPETAPDGQRAGASAAVAATASFEIPRVTEAMPAVTAVPVSAVQAEPLEELQALAPAAGPVQLTTPMLPMAGIIKASADAADLPFAAAASEPDTASVVASGRAILATALVEVSNGSGIERSGARFRAYLRDQGVPVKRLTNDAQFGHSRTVLYYRDGFLAAAQAIASELPMPIALERNDGQRSDLRLRLGLNSKPFDNYLAAGIITASR